MTLLRRLTHATRESRAFTLIELLIVISILGILATVSVFVYNSALDGTSQQATVDDYNTALCDTAEAVAEAMNNIEDVTTYTAQDFAPDCP